MQKIVPHLWYDSDAEAAARRYVELDPRLGDRRRSSATPRPAARSTARRPAR